MALYTRDEYNKFCDLMLKQTWNIWCCLPIEKKERHRGKWIKKNKKSPPLRSSFEIEKAAHIFQFINYYRDKPIPFKLTKEGDFCIFKKGIEPTWEDAANKDGGRWMFTVPPKDAMLIEVWNNLCLDVMGGTMDKNDAIVGIVLASRRNYIRFSVWIRDIQDNEVVDFIGNWIKEKIYSESNIELQKHRSDFDQYLKIITST